MNTPITYYGGKQKMLHEIVPLIPEHDIYCEPFVGGAAVLIRKPPSTSEIINDIDGMIALFYRTLQSNFEALKAKIDQTLYDRTTHKVALTIRSMPHLFSELQIAWAFFVLSTTGFSGTLDSFGCYTKGKKAQTFENKKKLITPELKHRFEGVQIENTDALRLIALRDTTRTFFYLDPPYPNTIQSHYRGYTEAMFEDLLIALSTLKGKFLLSSFPSLLLSAYTLKNGWYTKQVEQMKSASCNPDGSKKRKIEVLTANYPIQ